MNNPPPRYFQGMFSSYMKESVNSRVRLHGVDEPSFRAILSSFYSGFLSVCSKCVLRLLRTGFSCVYFVSVLLRFVSQLIDYLALAWSSKCG